MGRKIRGKKTFYVDFSKYIKKDQEEEHVTETRTQQTTQETGNKKRKQGRKRKIVRYVSDGTKYVVVKKEKNEVKPVVEEKNEVAPIIEKKEIKQVAKEKKGAKQVVKVKKEAQPIVEKKEVKQVIKEEEKVKPVVEEKKEVKQVVEKKEVKLIAEEKKEARPVVEEKKEVKPIVEEEKEAKPIVEEEKEVKPTVEEKKEVKPIVEEKKEVKPVVEEKKEVKPVVEEEKEAKPTVEEVKPVYDYKERLNMLRKVNPTMRTPDAKGVADEIIQAITQIESKTTITTYIDRLSEIKESLNEAPKLIPKEPIIEKPMPEKKPKKRIVQQDNENVGKKEKITPSAPTQPKLMIKTIKIDDEPTEAPAENKSNNYNFRERLKMIHQATNQEFKKKDSVIDDPALASANFKENLEAVIELQNKTFKNIETEKELEQLRLGKKAFRANRNDEYSTLKPKYEARKKVPPPASVIQPVMPYQEPQKEQQQQQKEQPKPKEEEKPLTEFQKKMLAFSQKRQKKILESNTNPTNTTTGKPKPATLNQRMATLFESHERDSKAGVNEPKEMKKLKLNNFHNQLNGLVSDQFQHHISLGGENERIAPSISKLKEEKKKAEQQNAKTEEVHETTNNGIAVHRTAHRRNVRPRNIP